MFGIDPHELIIADVIKSRILVMHHWEEIETNQTKNQNHGASRQDNRLLVMECGKKPLVVQKQINQSGDDKTHRRKGVA